MNEARLRALLRETPVPAEDGAAQRGLPVVSEAFAERTAPRRQVLPRLALAFAIGVSIAALALSPAGAKVRDWIGEVFTAGVPNAEPALTAIPGGGRLLVQSRQGPWVVQPDGARRLLGHYDDATWSPHGLFVAAGAGNTLSAIEPDGDPHWSISAEGTVADPRWSPSGFRIAYRAGRSLWVVAGDGTGKTLLDLRTAPLAPVWSPQGLALLAYVDSGSTVRIVDTDRREVLGAARALAGIKELEWAPDGSALLEASPSSLRLRRLTLGKLVSRLGIEPARELGLPAGARIDDAAFSPGGDSIAALLLLPARAGRPARSEAVLIDATTGSRRPLFSAPGRLSGLAWSPDGSRLLIGWRDANQWLFVPIGGRSHVDAIAGISDDFAPGARRPGSFPRIEGWCCRASSGPPSR
jgi:WD40 repeat protein